MELKFSQYRIQCIHPFGISRSSHTYYDIIYIYLIQDGIIGRGQAAPSQRYNEYPDKILNLLNSFPLIPGIEHHFQPVMDHLIKHSCGIKSLEAAFSMAVLDWWTQKHKQPLYEYFNADPSKTPHTSFTIAIGDLDKIAQKVEEAKPYSILKVKLGMNANKDKEIIRLIRRETDKLIRIDANEGWDLDTAKDMCNWLADQHVEFVEQPLKANELEQTAILKKVSPISIIADENSLTSVDIPKIAHAFHGINIKLMKCGSLLEAMKMIQIARQYKLEIMLGCMVESSIGITAAAHLSPLVDYADLDGHVLIDNDPYKGVNIVDGKLVLPTEMGIGTQLISSNPELL